eukprot:3866-Eustigmatos_ZCMA.PRE.1
MHTTASRHNHHTELMHTTRHLCRLTAGNNMSAMYNETGARMGHDALRPMNSDSAPPVPS